LRRKKTLESWAAGSRRRDVIKRAASDVARGLQDTDRRGAAATRKKLSTKSGR
jgi:hypothetical protein